MEASIKCSIAACELQIAVLIHAGRIYIYIDSQEVLENLFLGLMGLSNSC
jgi:hypothetical protein